MMDRKRAKAFTCLHDLVAEIQQYDFQPVELLRYVLRFLEEAMGYQHSLILSLRPDNGKLHSVSGRGFRADEKLHDFPVGQGVIGMAVKLGRAIRINNIGSIIRYSQTIRTRMEEQRPEGSDSTLRSSPSMNSQMVVPIKRKGRTIGTLSVESERPNAFDDADEELLTVVTMLVIEALHELQIAYTSVEMEPKEPDPLPEPAILSAREMEVALLAAEGISNAEIAARLVVSQRTVSTHLERVYRKLDVHSRSALTHYIVSHYGFRPTE
ncbi:LuxR C-terminal-related transcriptional regulator [Cohnella suwonensis]|uniref:LuxR C-terminal-related transcriptional regulator n=1 Tax=Cohnella suwonensis TaxID=696072 RepID=A0ABW0LU40_9BACL